MLYTECLASEASGSEDEIVLSFLYVFLCFKPRIPWGVAILNPEAVIEQTW